MNCIYINNNPNKNNKIISNDKPLYNNNNNKNDSDNNFIKETFMECVECGLFEEFNEMDFANVKNILNCLECFYPKYNHEEVMVASAVLCWVSLFEELLEDNQTNQEQQQILIKKYKDILIAGKNSLYIRDTEYNNLTPLEKYSLVIRFRLLKPTSQKRNEMIFDIFIHCLNEWFHSITTKTKSDSVTVGIYFLIAINSSTTDPLNISYDDVYNSFLF
ncbi:hypothetical protein DICPUDRAFT_77693 [Dictyostelium purpureum]|uniref:Uncharacterized protein n=1 Tax=Dictyostelium purpureum TaxID=5786 RepID=F0ZHC9_DICPU|nr:uncharacterized protein DICPUDRAFT_77693 [Dictyostelium purpureum]EGC36662.1 hypothetical protein DICPUDRAFT_77693 [Dictyostelium purpureum]|eukprot:XP_003286830.1 hypothetical protein DICPUDRAFT_77693 [Dictyostelium purpureum]